MVCRALETETFIEVSMRKSAALATIIIVTAGLSGACNDSTGPETDREYFS